MNNITMGMTSQEKQVYFNHLEKRTSEEQERVNAQRKRVAIYRESLIAEILNCNSNFFQNFDDYLNVGYGNVPYSKNYQ